MTLTHKFNWQEGYGGFSYSKSHLDNVIKYILNQEEHHKKQTFKENIIRFQKNLKLNMMRNIYLNGLNNKQVAPTELLNKYAINATNSKPLRGYQLKQKKTKDLVEVNCLQKQNL